MAAEAKAVNFGAASLPEKIESAARTPLMDTTDGVAKSALEADAYSTGLYCLGSHGKVRVLDRPLRKILVKRKDSQLVLQENIE